MEGVKCSDEFSVNLEAVGRENEANFPSAGNGGVQAPSAERSEVYLGDKAAPCC